MNKLRAIFLIILLQYVFAFLSLNMFESELFISPESSFKLMFVLPLIILMSMAALKSLTTLDKTFIDSMIDVEMDIRDKELEEYNDELEVLQHEVFRDIQMIKVLAENSNEEEIKEYLL
jgi:hypothetical protein